VSEAAEGPHRMRLFPSFHASRILGLLLGSNRRRQGTGLVSQLMDAPCGGEFFFPQAGCVAGLPSLSSVRARPFFFFLLFIATSAHPRDGTAPFAPDVPPVPWHYILIPNLR